MRRGRLILVGLLLNTILVLGVGGTLVWYPLWRHYRVTAVEPSPAVIAAHRHDPSSAVLATAADAAMMTDHPLRGEAALIAARRILAGELALPAFPVLPVRLEFAEQDLEMGVPVQQLFVASLIVPELLLRAHEYAPDSAFITAARVYMRGFIAHEAKAQFPTGFLFDDHAVANRVAVLVHFWQHVRADPRGDDATAREVHRHAARLAAFLSKPQMFVGTTNRGVMQNIALLQLAVAFPRLPNAAALWALAEQRLALQLPMYIGPDGAVLEHSAGYHFHGVVLTGHVVQLYEAAGRAAPLEWLRAHESSRRFLALMQRPDRSLPALGNTYRYAWTLPSRIDGDPAAWEQMLHDRPTFAHEFPVSGTAIWWDPGDATVAAVQTLIPWGYFAGHGHKRAQELGLLIWADGTDWSTNSGYWPRDDVEGFERANGWGGGGGPHVLGEPGDSRRRSSVLARGQRQGLHFLDLERVVEGGPRVRRQIVHLQRNTWLTLDTYRDTLDRPLRVVWTAAPETERHDLGERAFRFSRAGKSLGFTVTIDGSPVVTASPLLGSRSPFGGWVAFDRRAAAAPSIDARLSRPGGWMLTTQKLGVATTATRASMVRFGGPEDWELRLPLATGTLSLARHGHELVVHEPGEKPARLVLAPADDPGPQLTAIEQAGVAVRNAYPRFRTGEWERRRYTQALIVLWLAISVAVLTYALWPVRQISR